LYFDATTRNFGNGLKKGNCSRVDSSLNISSACRNYPLKKIQENNEAEIMEVVLDEARSSYSAEIVVELKSEGTDDLEGNVARIVQWIKSWRADHGTDDGETVYVT
jgi:broad-specificity NMP kinase